MPAGRPTKYDPEFHPLEVIELGKQGYFKVEIAQEWDVDCSTIDEWARKHPEFSLAYKRACQFRASWLMKQAKKGLHNEKGSSFNAIAWSMMMRYDGQNTDERTVKLPELADCKTFLEMSHCLVKAFGDGRLTPKEANTLADLISKGIRVDEVTDLRVKLEAIELARKRGK